MTNHQIYELTTAANSRFATAGVLCFYDSEVLNSSFVLRIKFSAGRQFIAPKSASWPSPKTLTPMLNDDDKNSYIHNLFCNNAYCTWTNDN